MKTRWTRLEWWVLTRVLPLLPGDCGERLLGRLGVMLMRYGSMYMYGAGTVRSVKHPPAEYIYGRDVN
jgi:hypothetical protein